MISPANAHRAKTCSNAPMDIPSVDPGTESFIRALSEALRAAGLADEAALTRASRIQAKTGQRFDTVLSELGIVPERALAGAVAQALGLPLAGDGQLPEAPLLPDLLPQDFLARARLVPIALTDADLTLAMTDPFNEDAVRSIAYLTRRVVRRTVLTASDFEAAFARLFDSTPLQSRLEAGGEAASDASDADDVERLKDIASEAPVIRFVNDMIARAVERRASDIHVEPQDDHLRVRFRRDGRLEETESLPRAMHAAVTSRLKIMARLDIAERRLPQDGRIKLAVRGREIDFRVSTMPTLHGEGVVLRVLDRSAVALDFASLGFDAGCRDVVPRPAWRKPNGIMLVTGPTGSGKTTTLYAALSRAEQIDRKIITVEDPIEYQIDGINQIQVNAGHRARLRPRAALDPAPGSRRHHGRRDPRPRDGRDRHAGVADRPSRVLDAAHQQRRGRDHAAARHGRRAVSLRVDVAGRPGAARSSASSARTAARPIAGPSAVKVRRDRLCRPHRPSWSCSPSARNRSGTASLRQAEAALEAAAVAFSMRQMYADGTRRVEAGETILEEVLLATQLAR